MKHIQYKFFSLLLCCLVLAGCDKYLDITPRGKTLLTTVSHYDQWLNDETLLLGFSSPQGIVNYLGDNVDYVNVPAVPVTALDMLYTWQEQFALDLNVAPLFWGEHYSKINRFNTVLLGIDNATGGTNSQKRSLRAEALLGRALEYFYLVNEYAVPYDSATALKDLAVPFVISNDVSQVVPGRSTVAEIYDHIITDITNALEDLPADNSANRFRGSIAAAYSVLARVYFYARNYTEAQKNAELALQHTKAEMIDYNGALPVSNLVSTRADVIYGRMVIGSAVASLDYMRSFASTDLRTRKFYYSTDSYRFTTRGATQYYPGLITPVFTYENTGTSVQEMKLIIAEAAARKNQLSAALQQLDEVRKNRFPAGYTRFETTNAEDAIKEVLKERNHELGFMGLRWFDMRRLDKENRMDTVRRYNAQGTVVATLPPHSKRYTFQIPVQVLSFNPGMQQNP